MAKNCCATPAPVMFYKSLCSLRCGGIDGILPPGPPKTSKTYIATAIRIIALVQFP